jgi:hypothetical protein
MLVSTPFVQCAWTRSPAWNLLASGEPEPI